MGYRFTVGEAELRSEPSEQRVWISAKVVYRDDTPFEREECRANWIEAGYGWFANWCKRVGLSELFFGGGWNPTLREYDECVSEFHREQPLNKGLGQPAMLCEGDLKLVREARIAWERHVDPRLVSFQTELDALDYAYLVWFEWWFAWALENCQTPILEIR